MDSLKSHLVIMFTFLFSLSHASTMVGELAKSNETDLAALLQFRSQISDDPDEILGMWNDTVHFCDWPGIACSRRHLRVTNLELPGSRFSGSLSPYIGNLSFLGIINMDNNGLTGEIPPEIGNLRRLTVLSLENNSFSGSLPESISGCRKLRDITLRNNKLVGEIPHEFAALSELRFFQISGNNFSGNFPEFFGNFSSLEVISAVYNNFKGTIPASLGRLQKLQLLTLGYNSFSGTIPASIFNITSLDSIGLVSNQLEGGLPQDMGTTLPNLFFIGFGDNHLTGIVPPSIGNATKLEMLQIPRNNFTGSVPDLSNLHRLRWLIITRNQLGSGKSGDLTYLESLNSTNLQALFFNSNNFGGTLPQTIGNLSSNLVDLYFDSTQLTGSIPSSIGNLRNLERINIGWNRLTGRLPREIGNLNKLRILGAPFCQFSGEIPSSLGNLTMLMILSLAGNEFQGSIPTSLGKCQNLMALDLSRNNLSGIIPLEVLRFPSVVAVDLSSNILTGALPDEIGGLNKLSFLYVQENRLSGRVPSALGDCSSLLKLYMQKNLFEGNISSFLSPLKGLQYLDLSLNNFSGGIPKFLGNFQLSYLNLSFNHFEGGVPNQGVFLNATGISVMGNDKLCGGISALHLPSCPTSESKQSRRILSKVIIGTASGIVVLFVVLLLLAAHFGMKAYRRSNIKPLSTSLPGGSFPQISYDDIFRATGGLNQSNLIGAGSSGSVFKGILGNGNNTVAIKVLNTKNQAASKSFMTECAALRNIRHRNLVKISTVCSTIDFRGNDFKALVYAYMENGSLEDWLHSKVALDGEQRVISLLRRLSIAIDIAYAVAYLHHECEITVIHCDLKPSNILLDAEMTAHVADFGLAKILSVAEVDLQVSSVGLRGTISYSPPEYGMGNQVSREGDVYSYGILLLEIFTGKRPTNGTFNEALNIRGYCEAALPDRAAEIADPRLFINELGEGSSFRAPRRVREGLGKIFEVGIGCCNELPGERMDIREAAMKLQFIKALVC